MDKIAKLGNLGELKHLNRDNWIVMSINSIINKQNEIIDVLNQNQPEEAETVIGKWSKKRNKKDKPEKQEEWREKLNRVDFSMIDSIRGALLRYTKSNQSTPLAREGGLLICVSEIIDIFNGKLEEEDWKILVQGFKSKLTK